MRHSNNGRFRQQVQFLRRQFLQDGDLPFSNVLSEDRRTGRAPLSHRIFRYCPRIIFGASRAV